jgi:ferrous iron transport protein B
LVAALPRAAPVSPGIGALPPDPDPYTRNRHRMERIHAVLAEVYSIAQPAHASLAVRLGFWAMHPVKGILLVLAVLAGLFWFVGLFGAGLLVDGLETGIFEQRLRPLAIAATDRILPFPHQHAREAIRLELELPLTPVHGIPLLDHERTVTAVGYELGAAPGRAGRVARFGHDFLVGEYGLVTMGLSYALAIVLPIVVTFFLVFALLEDSGYLPRLSVMLHRVFRLMGLNGKAVLPMILGLGCDTMATMTTRILETRKERVVTTMLLALAVPCSAQLGVLLAMMAALSPLAAVAWLALLTGIALLVGWLTARLFDEAGSDFILEIPPLRRPQLRNVLTKTRLRVGWYLKEVIPIFVVGTAALFLLDASRLLGRITALAEPLVTGWLGLPAQASNAFLVGFLRRDFGAVYLLDAATGPVPELSRHQIFVAMVTITLFMPCFANFLMVAKEHGWKTAWRMAAFIFPFAFLVGGLVHRLTGG